MIGQAKLCDLIDSQIEVNKYPRCSLIIGQRGSGKRTLAKYIADKMQAQCVITDGKIDDVRQIIALANASHTKTVYVFADADKMSQNAEYAVLKLLEEPPNNAYLIVTAQSENGVLDTIKSRSVVYHMQAYTPDEIMQYYGDDKELIKQICETPGDVDSLVKNGVDKVYSYAELVADNLGEVTGANAFKIGSKIAFKDEPEKIDILTFFKTFLAVCYARIDVTYAKWIQITLDYIQQLNIKGVNKTMLFDNWVLDCRQILF